MRDVDVAIAAAQAGAAIVRTRYGSSLTRIAKSSSDFATDVDAAAERAIADVLGQARPGDAILGEEFGRSGNPDAARAWLVDPLCGTLNFAARTPPFSVNVALVDAEHVVAAAVADPLAGELYWTDGEFVALRTDAGDSRVSPASESRLIDVNLDGPYPAAERFTAATFLTSSAFRATLRPRVSSTTLALTWVATGQRAGYVTDGTLRRSVHFTSGIALCEAAGCIVTNLGGGRLHTGLGGLVAAADQETHDVLMAAVLEQIGLD